MSIKLTDKIESLHGIGEQTEKKLHRLDIFQIKDLLFHFPFRYEDTSKITDITDLIPLDEPQTIQGEIISIKNIFTRNRKKLTTAKVADATGEIEVLWFNQHFLKKMLKPGTKVLLSGKIDPKGHQKLISPNYEIINEFQEPIHLARITPIYPETKGLTSKFLRKIIKDLFEYGDLENIVLEILTNKVLEENKLVPRHKAIKYLHFPQNMEEIEKGRNRIAFEEIYEILRKVQEQKEMTAQFKSNSIKTNKCLVNKFLKELPFQPTNAQNRSIDEILEDLAKDTPMNRLLEGDVGSGKTLVAIAAIINAVSNNFQVAFLAPTQVLAEQHFKTFSSFVPWIKEEIELITGNTRKQRAANEKKIIIGTHAILHQAQNLFNNLGLVIIDEQHRFGVKQREFLSEFSKGDSSSRAKSRDPKSGQNSQSTIPHILTMTATPIPRSLILTLYGDLDLSVLDELPSGRIPLETHIVSNAKRDDAYNWIREEIKNGGQAFVICPLVEESEKLQVRSAKAEYERLSSKIFPDLKVALLHGKIKSKEKEEILTGFRNRKYDILVSTAVVEVGIDIPNATVMVIEGAERFGLAQLHQFRGRVGRSDKKSYCLLFTDSDSEKSIERLHFFASTNDGLKIAEYDLKSRGPGEVYGTRQTGIPNLKFASLMDLGLIRKVRKALVN